MAKPLVSDVLWKEVEPLLPPLPSRPRGSRPRLPDRAVPVGTIFVLRTGMPWELLPPEMGCGSGYDLLAERGGLPLVAVLTGRQHA